MKRSVISSVVAVCVLCVVIVMISRSASTQTAISDCKQPFGNPPCNVNNSATFNNGANTGCKFNVLIPGLSLRSNPGLKLANAFGVFMQISN